MGPPSRKDGPIIMQLETLLLCCSVRRGGVLALR